MEYSSKHFRDIEKIVKDIVEKNRKENSRYYIVRDIFGRISMYIEGDDSIAEWKEVLSNSLDKWLLNVQSISPECFIYEEVAKEAKFTKNGISFQERPLVKGVWNKNIQFGDKIEKTRAKVITFYSYKGGLGRTTTLSMVALNLARQGKRVVVLDFDLEAPGVATILRPSDGEYPLYGVVDFLIEKNIVCDMDIDEYVYPVTSKKLLGVNGGSLFVMQATNENDGVEEFYSKLSRLDFSAPQYKNAKNPVATLLKQIDDRYDPDYILIDSRAGIHDIGGLAMLKFSDEVALLFYGNKQNMFGMKFVLSKIIEQNIPFYLINSPIPINEDSALEEKDIFINNSYDVLVKNGFYSEDAVPDINDEMSEHYPVDVFYNELATSISNDAQVEMLLSTVKVYEKIARDLAIKEDKNREEISFDENDGLEDVLDAIVKISLNDAPAAENEFRTKEDFKNKFYPLKEYRYIFDWDKFLILGPKGSGKTALFSVLNCSEYAHALAEYIGVRNTDSVDTTWLTAMNKGEGFPRKDNFKTIAINKSQSIYRSSWLCFMVRTLKDWIDKYFTEIPDVLLEIYNCEYSGMDKCIKKYPNISELLLDILDKLDKRLGEDNQALVMIYDALDTLLEKPYRGDMIAALIDLWFDNIAYMKNLRAKIFLREDIFKNEVQTGITDKIKVKNYTANLEWNYDCLLAMIWKRIAENSKKSPSFIQTILEKEGYKLPYVNDTIGYVPLPNEEINKIVLDKLIGERMGKGKKAYTYNWISYRLSDTKGNIVPRSILKLFSFAAKKEKESIMILANKNSVLRPKSLENSMEEVSEDRIREMAEEYETYREIFHNLKNYCSSAPINNDDLIEGLKGCGVDGETMQSTIDELIEIGVLREYRRKKADPIRYHIPDIYLKGMGINRKGYK